MFGTSSGLIVTFFTEMISVKSTFLTFTFTFPMGYVYYIFIFIYMRY